MAGDSTDEVSTKIEHPAKPFLRSCVLFTNADPITPQSVVAIDSCRLPYENAVAASTVEPLTVNILFTQALRFVKSGASLGMTAIRLRYGLHRNAEPCCVLHTPFHIPRVTHCTAPR